MPRIVRYVNKNWTSGDPDFFIEEPIDDSVTDINTFCENICQNNVCNQVDCNKENCGIYVSQDGEFYHYKNLPSIP